MVVGKGVEYEGEEGSRVVRGVRFEVDERDESGAGEEVESDPTEITPLLVQQRSANGGGTGGDGKGGEADVVAWWIVQMLLVVPFPVILLAHILVMLIDATGQSVADGGSLWVG